MARGVRDSRGSRPSAVGASLCAPSRGPSVRGTRCARRPDGVGGGERDRGELVQGSKHCGGDAKRRGAAVQRALACPRACLEREVVTRVDGRPARQSAVDSGRLELSARSGYRPCGRRGLALPGAGQRVAERSVRNGVPAGKRSAVGDTGGQLGFATSPLSRPRDRKRLSGVDALAVYAARDHRWMPKGGLEPPRAIAHCTLNAARLPVPPLRQGSRNVSDALGKGNDARPVRCGTLPVLSSLLFFRRERRDRRHVTGPMARRTTRS